MSDSPFKPASYWQAIFSNPTSAVVAEVARMRHESHAEARKAIRWYGLLLAQALERFGQSSDRPTAVFRAPGRVNLLGTHIDHRGGRVNPIAVRELALVCFPREDGRVAVANANPGYTAAEFSIAQLLPDGHISGWADWTLGTPQLLEEQGLLGHWSSYVRASVAYFANAWGGSDGLRGFDLFVGSRLPQAAGLSSSSALVVASAQAFHHVNARPVEPLTFAEECGQAEWYVGTRGGSGDQAAIALSRAGHVSHVDFYPMSVSWSPWPKGYSVVVCHSRVHAQKTSNARSIFNERVATYGIALLWIKHLHADWAPRLAHLRDVLRLGLPDAEIYRMLKQLPQRASRSEVLAALPEARSELEKLFTTHDDPSVGKADAGYRVRAVCLYGLAECERSRQLADCLRDGDIFGVGALINLSHEGDRVTVVNEAGDRVNADRGVDDDELDGLIEAVESGDEQRAHRASLARQPGGYACSSPDLDELVDLARSVEGVLGAGLIGAGIGGCVEVVVADDAVGPLREKLLAEYYEKRGREPFIEALVPVEGAGPLRFDEKRTPAHKA